MNEMNEMAIELGEIAYMVLEPASQHHSAEEIAEQAERYRLAKEIAESREPASQHRLAKEIAESRQAEKHRLAKEIAESILTNSSSTEQAYLYCLHKLTNGTQQPKLWRDVLACIDELTGEKK